MLPITGKATLAVCITHLAIHFHFAPLVGPLVFVGMLPFIAHTLQHQPQCTGTAGTGRLSGNKHAVRAVIIVTGFFVHTLSLIHIFLVERLCALACNRIWGIDAPPLRFRRKTGTPGKPKF